MRVRFYQATACAALLALSTSAVKLQSTLADEEEQGSALQSIGSILTETYNLLHGGDDTASTQTPAAAGTPAPKGDSS